MPSLDLDDLPQKIARALEALAPGEELVLTRAGAVVARLALAPSEPAAPAEPPAAMAPEHMTEVMEHFASIIEDEF